MTLTLRPMNAADAPLVHEIMRASIRDGAGRFYTACQRAAWMPAILDDRPMPEAFAARLAQQAGWLAISDARAVGFMTCEANGHLDLAFVRPDWMGRGVAAGLLGALLDWACARNLPALTTEASHFFYRFLRRHGWDLVAAETLWRNGVALERFRMALPLTPQPTPAPTR